MGNPPAFEVNDNGHVHMPFSDGKLVYADAVHSLKAEHSDTQDDECESL